MAISGGILGLTELAATTYTTLYKPAAGVLATVTVTFCNRSASQRTIRLAVAQSETTNPTPDDGGFKTYDRVLFPAGHASGKDVFQFSGMVLNGAGNDQVVGYASGEDISATIDGITEGE